MRSGGHDFAGSSCTSPARGAYANFPDTELPDEHRAYWGSNLARVQRVKEKYDPERVFG